MKNKAPFQMIYFLTRPLFLGMIYAKVFTYAGSSAPLACILGTLIGFIIIRIIHLLKESFIEKYINFIIYSLFIFTGMMILETYIGSFFLNNTPLIVIIIPTILLCLYASQKSYQTIFISSRILFYHSIILFSFCFISLTSYFNFNNLLPIIDSNSLGILKASLVFGILSATPNILVKDNIDFKNNLKYYVITSIINIFICIAIQLTLTSNVAKIYSFPEYMVLKRIKYFEFIENFENIVAAIWYIDIFYFMTMSMKKLNEVIKKPKISFIYIALLTTLSTYKIINKYYIVLFLYHLSWALYLLLLILKLLLSKKKS